MFKVVCITNGNGEIHKLEVGSEYTVVRVFRCGCGCGKSGYALSETTPVAPFKFFIDSLFAQCSGPDEKDLAQERERDFSERMDKVRKGIEREINKMPA